MRKYRGLTKEGKWVKGWHFTFEGCTDGQEFTQHLIGDLEDHQEVLPESVGQSTGKHDKGGKEIYKGDILDRPGSAPDDERIKADVYFEDGCFWCGGDPLFVGDLAGQSEVIGNVAQNPELLEQGNGL